LQPKLSINISAAISTHAARINFRFFYLIAPNNGTDAAVKSEMKAELLRGRVK
jgi:hypothetical protein